MGNFFDLSTVAKRFRFIAVLEAISWIGLLTGMAFKYSWLGLPDPGNEIGVKIFGPVHGIIFMLFLVTALLAARELNWNWKTTVLALASSIPPLFTVIFEVWAQRTGQLGELSAPSPVAGQASAVSS
ncbi:integral membrane protein [Nocardia goodfellowii]|uniref:Integral membrane protein n=2 Tax=Nocardia goodfellowii TaxID=882446 RepID=A0ABS4QS31_9NOCA|nr:integral membrane protein [Nocardia goodfellowii]